MMRREAVVWLGTVGLTLLLSVKAVQAGGDLAQPSPSPLLETGLSLRVPDYRPDPFDAPAIAAVDPDIIADVMKDQSQQDALRPPEVGALATTIPQPATLAPTSVLGSDSLLQPSPTQLADTLTVAPSTAASDQPPAATTTASEQPSATLATASTRTPASTRTASPTVPALLTASRTPTTIPSTAPTLAGTATPPPTLAPTLVDTATPRPTLAPSPTQPPTAPPTATPAPPASDTPAPLPSDTPSGSGPDCTAHPNPDKPRPCQTP